MVWGRRIVAAVSLALLGAVVAAPVADATFAGRPGLIAFDSPGRLWTIAADGHGGPRKIGEGVDPTWSPSGKLIAFVKGENKLMVERPDGDGLHTVLVSDEIGEPCFSADGKTIFFVKDTSGEGYSDLWSVPLAGGEPRRLTHTGSRTSDIDTGSPEAAANGRFVVYQRNGTIWTMRPDGSRQRELARGSTPSVSPSSHLIVFARNEKLGFVRAGGSGERTIVPFSFRKQPQELFRAVGSPAFSPDGREVAFTFRRTDDAGPHLHDTKRLVVYSLRTHKLRVLTGPAVNGTHADWQPLR